MATLKYKDSQGNLQPIVGYNVYENEVVQTTGTSTTAVMSQSAVTTKLNDKIDKSNAISNVEYDNTAGKIIETKNNVISDIVTAQKLYQDSGATSYARKTDFDLNVLKQAVADGDLGKYGLKPGDQKTINGHTYVITGLNPMKGTAAPSRVAANHVGLIVIPHTTHAWNADGKTTAVEGGHGAGYMNSELHAYLNSDILPMCNTDLGAANLIGHSKQLSSAVNANGYNRFGEATGCSSGWTLEDTKICALSEVQIYGAAIWSSSGYDTGEACRQLDVFQRYSHTEIFGGEYPWLRDVASAAHAAFASHAGAADAGTASVARYVAGLILFK